MEKTGVMWVGQRRKELEIHTGGSKLKQRDNLFYLSGAIYGDGNSDIEIRRRLTAVATAWRKVKGKIIDRLISCKLKEMVLTSCVTPTYMYGLEIMAVIKKVQEKVQVCGK